MLARRVKMGENGNSCHISNLTYTDNAIVLVDPKESLHRHVENFVDVCDCNGMKVNVGKTLVVVA